MIVPSDSTRPSDFTRPFEDKPSQAVPLKVAIRVYRSVSLFPPEYPLSPLNLIVALWISHLSKILVLRSNLFPVHTFLLFAFQSQLILEPLHDNFVRWLQFGHFRLMALRRAFKLLNELLNWHILRLIFPCWFIAFFRVARVRHVHSCIGLNDMPSQETRGELQLAFH